MDLKSSTENVALESWSWPVSAIGALALHKETGRAVARGSFRCCLAFVEERKAEHIASGSQGYIFLSIDSVGDWLSIDLLSGIEVPEHFPRFGVHGNELSIQFA